MIGLLLTTVFVSHYGQKVAMLFALPTLAISWILMGIATTPGHVLFSRIIHGLYRAFAITCAPTYIAEILHFTIRGKYSSMVLLFSKVGMFSVAIIGNAGISWRKICLIYGTVTLVTPFIGILLFPQSPRWLSVQGREDDALKALKFFRGSNYDTQKEFNEIIDQQQSLLTSNTFCKIKYLFFGSERKNFFLSIVLNVLYCCSGNMQVVLFSAEIFESFNLPFKSNFGTSFCMAVRIASCLILIFTADKFGSKCLFSATVLLSSICMFVISLYYGLLSNNIDASSFFWASFIALLLFHGRMSANMSCLILLISELLSTPIRQIGAGIFSFCSNVASFLTRYGHASLVLYLGSHRTFFIYALCNLMSFILAVIFVPETKDKTLEEITNTSKGR